MWPDLRMRSQRFSTFTSHPPPILCPAGFSHGAGTPAAAHGRMLEVHGFLFQHHAEFAADVTEFLG